ncbi:SIMPL domain-containing protein [Halospeciosus flavus]|uniref:SIMPL domain-containing protein n=1 Tax=Halospeciosus flavus TaxID=3032283 RepID=A0ABD5Z6G1_9EURY|nr:SIMPL domain-containing protein [Halospeciosus flavus]
MRLNRTLPALALVLMLLTAGCTGFVGNTSTGTAVDGGGAGPTVTVSATGQISAEPDQAIVRVAVVETATDPNAARTQLAENVSAMREALREMGIGDDQVQTAHFDISQDYRQQPDQPTRYRAIHAFEVTLNDTSRVGAVIDTAVENGATRVDGVQFTLSDAKRQQLHDEALAAAMDRADGRASALAGEANLSITGVSAVQSADASVRPYRAETAMLAAGSAGGATSVESGPVTVSAHVTVVYNATSA